MSEDTVIAPEAEFTLLKRQLVGLQRRSAVRYRCALATLGRISFPETGEVLETWIANLSEAGIGLNLPKSIDPGISLTIFLKGPNHDGAVRLTAKVVHSTPEADGSFRIGCEFETRLQPEQLESLL